MTAPPAGEAEMGYRFPAADWRLMGLARAARRFRRAGACLVACWLAAACGPSVEMKVQSQVPEPALSPLPIALGVYYPDSLRQHAFEEDSEDRGEWRIQTGQAQLAMFRRILPSLSQELRTVSNLPPKKGSELDAVLSPKLANMQLALPEETQFDFYEAWVRYKVRLFDPGGDLIGAWRVTGYGKVAKGGIFDSQEESLNAAINAALRDAGGQLALGFEDEKVVRQWLCRKKALAETDVCEGGVSA